MSRGIDYSKWDHIDEDDSSDDEQQKVSTQTAATSASKCPMPPTSFQSSEPNLMLPQNVEVSKQTKEGSEKGRYRFEYGGRLIYEWEQNLDEVNIYVDAPPNISASAINCKISAAHLTLGIKGATNNFLDESTFSKVEVDSSSWYISDNVIHIVLAKAHRGLTWESALLGHDGKGIVDPVTKQNIQKDMMLERFQEEHPGFDFRDANFNGSIPDPRTFMGGVGYR